MIFKTEIGQKLKKKQNILTSGGISDDVMGLELGKSNFRGLMECTGMSRIHLIKSL